MRAAIRERAVVARSRWPTTPSTGSCPKRSSGDPRHQQRLAASRRSGRARCRRQGARRAGVDDDPPRAQMKEAARNLEFSAPPPARRDPQLRRLRELAAAPAASPPTSTPQPARREFGNDPGAGAAEVFSTAARPNIIAAGSRRRPAAPPPAVGVAWPARCPRHLRRDGDRRRIDRRRLRGRAARLCRLRRVDVGPRTRCRGGWRASWTGSAPAARAPLRVGDNWYEVERPREGWRAGGSASTTAPGDDEFSRYLHWLELARELSPTGSTPPARRPEAVQRIEQRISPSRRSSVARRLSSAATRSTASTGRETR